VGRFTALHIVFCIYQEAAVPENLTTAMFKEKVFDYDKSEEWKYAGTVPCIIDFYADWCGPCKMVAPVLEKVSQDYQGKLLVYKVNTDKEQELAGAFGVQSIPSLLFVPLEGRPQMAVGALPRASLDKAIKDVLAVEPAAAG
jgi:thioredoxin 1